MAKIKQYEYELLNEVVQNSWSIHNHVGKIISAPPCFLGNGWIDLDTITLLPEKRI